MNLTKRTVRISVTPSRAKELRTEAQYQKMLQFLYAERSKVNKRIRRLEVKIIASRHAKHGGKR